jgi:hypothetical protein
MFLFWSAFLSPSIQLENIIIAFCMKHYKVGCVSISIKTLLFVELRERERETDKERKEEAVSLGDSILPC